MTDTAADFVKTDRNRVRRRPDRGRYDRKTVYEILDAAMICHIAYAIDGQPFCTPTAFWREGDHLYWHGSSASRMIRAQSKGLPVCLTVTHMDAIVLARSAFHHSINYRSVMAYGRAHAVAEGESKRRALDAFVDRFFPGRAAALRAPTQQEIKQMTIIGMEIDEAAGKIRALDVQDEEEDYVVPVWTALIPVKTVIESARECPRLHKLANREAGGMDAYAPGRRLDAVMAETHRTAFPE